jgi:hypothetical protein
MAIIIGPGISVGRGISVGIVTPYVEPAMRVLLSESGKTSFDEATENDFFLVSQTDYNAVASGLSSVTKYVLNDTFAAQVNLSIWGLGSGFARAYPSDIATIPSGVYLFGFIYRTQTSSTVTPLISTTFLGTYEAIANSPTTSSGGGTIATSVISYFLRKSSTPTAVTSYVGITSTGGNIVLTTTEFTYYYDSSSPYSTWNTASLDPIPIFQMLGTPTKQW